VRGIIVVGLPIALGQNGFFNHGADGNKCTVTVIPEPGQKSSSPGEGET
jgi:hypothetical protein